MNRSARPTLAACSLARRTGGRAPRAAALLLALGFLAAVCAHADDKVTETDFVRIEGKRLQASLCDINGKVFPGWLYGLNEKKILYFRSGQKTDRPLEWEAGSVAWVALPNDLLVNTGKGFRTGLSRYRFDQTGGSFDPVAELPQDLNLMSGQYNAKLVTGAGDYLCMLANSGPGNLHLILLTNPGPKNLPANGIKYIRTPEGVYTFPAGQVQYRNNAQLKAEFDQAVRKSQKVQAERQRQEWQEDMKLATELQRLRTLEALYQAGRTIGKK